MSDNTEHPGEHHDVTKAQRDNPPNKSILALVLATLTTLAVVVLAVVQYFNMSVREEIDRKVESAGNPVLNALRADEQLRLEHYGWVTEDAELRTIADWTAYTAGWTGALHG